MSADGQAIADGELVGRRVFDKKLAQLSSVADVPSNTFFDSRLQDDLSVDFLGKGSANKSIVRQLTTLADISAKEQSTTFLGWIANHKKNIKETRVIRDSLSEKLHGIENPFHGLIDRAGARERATAFHLSRSLLFMFQQDGQVVQPLRHIPKAIETTTA